MKFLFYALGALVFSLPGVLADAIGNTNPADPFPANRVNRPPNIVYILADDLGYGDVHCLNLEHGKIPTPNLDHLATTGLTATDAHAAAAVCTPSRYAILTGRYPFRSRLQSGVLDAYATPLIDSSRLTVAGLLHSAGYENYAIGKWHLGFTIEGGFQLKGKNPGMMGAPVGARIADGPTTRGFDHYFGFHHARVMKSLFVDDRVDRLVEPVDMLPLLTQHAEEVIAARAADSPPFFIYLALSSPHTPIVPGKEWIGRSHIDKYADFVMETDWAVGRVLGALDRAGLTDHTLVIFTSDNGYSPLSGSLKDLNAVGHLPSANLRGYKADIWDGGHRIPFFARWPGHIAAGSTTHQLIGLVDFMATTAALLDVKLPPNAAEDSVNLLPLLTGATHEPVRQYLITESINGSFTLRDGSWKICLTPGSGGWAAPTPQQAWANPNEPRVQLYNLADDLGEKHNLAAGNPFLIADLTATLTEQILNGRSTPGPRQENDVPVSVWKNPKKTGFDPAIYEK
jgi:arylsulfatase A